MTERTRRATELVDAHTALWDACRPGSPKAVIEDTLLPRRPEDGPAFQTQVRDHIGRAMAFTATTELWQEILLTLDMMTEESIEFLPLRIEDLPARNGFFLAPHGVAVPYDAMTHGEPIVRPGRVEVPNGGDAWWVDGFAWWTSDVGFRDGTKRTGITVMPLTRWRGNPTDRPFLTSHLTVGIPTPTPELVGSDVTAWAFDQDHWVDADDVMTDYRAWLRGLVWATFRWMTEEVAVAERPERAAFRRAKPMLGSHRPEDGSIVIVDLRPERRDHTAGNGEPPWWRTRWIVRGHRAKRRYAIRGDDGTPIGPTRGPDAEQGRTWEYRWVWIEPYEKGPENAPLVLKEKAGVIWR